MIHGCKRVPFIATIHKNQLRTSQISYPVRWYSLSFVLLTRFPSYERALQARNLRKSRLWQLMQSQTGLLIPVVKAFL